MFWVNKYGGCLGRPASTVWRHSVSREIITPWFAFICRDRFVLDRLRSLAGIVSFLIVCVHLQGSFRSWSFAFICRDRFVLDRLRSFAGIVSFLIVCVHLQESFRSWSLVVCLLSLELFILGVQANKLHFCNLELILNKTGYSHIMENKKKFHFLTWEPVEKNLTPLVFSNFLRNPPEFLVRK